MTARPAQMRVYKAGDGWRWRLVSPNGRIIADSGESYITRAGARRAARTIATVSIVTYHDGVREVLR